MRLSRVVLLFIGWAVHSSPVCVQADPPAPSAESIFFTPPGSTREGEAKTTGGPTAGTLKIVVRDAVTGRLAPCRINVIGPDGNFYQPPEDRLSCYALTGEWPLGEAKGNRRDKAPYRYLGRSFYSAGETTVQVPSGEVRIEVFKGFEYQPRSQAMVVTAGTTHDVAIALQRTAPMSELNYFGGDPHLHLARSSERDEATIFDLLDAEDIWYGTPLGYNEPAGPYSGTMDKLDYPQLRGLGASSVASRGPITILSGQEYRSSQYGHLNLFLRDRLVAEGQDFNADEWPVFGLVGEETKSQGGYAFHAHGGYGLEIYADAALGSVHGVELLQFGIYRGIGLDDWYHMLNTGYRFPCVGASDYPACRFLGDCRTYVWATPGAADTDAVNSSSPYRPTFGEWFQAAADGKSFVTTGPLLALEVNGKRPGETVTADGPGKTRGTITARVRSEVTPVTHLDVIVNGRVAHAFEIPEQSRQGQWFEARCDVEMESSGWIAARAWSTTPDGRPDAEAHTNPVFISLNGRKPYIRTSLDAWVAKIDGQLEKHRVRPPFRNQEKVLDYFQRARDMLLKIRERGGLLSGDDPAAIAASMETEAAIATDVSRPDVAEADLKEFLKPVPPKPPAEAVKAFEGVDGFRMELVAAEPLVSSPIAAAFDEDGNLYVCEMKDYPYKPAEGREPIGSVRLLRDTDGDGVYDEARTFADNLLWAAGVVPWRGGAFVAACPDIWYFKDTDGDGKADVSRKVFTGFGTNNQQAMVNNLQLGMDGWVYGATAGNGGTIRPADQPSAEPVSVDGRDFRFDPETERFETITGTVQFGNSFDDWGNRFMCSESSPILQSVLPERYLARNPYLPSPGGVHALTPNPTPIFRISPVERWRQIRSMRRVASKSRSAASAGASHHVIDAAAGVTIYRGGAYPSECYGQMFVGDGQNNIIHRRVLVPDGVSFRAERVDKDTEFIRSPDIWFRPVNLINAPDGTLYCCDMSREVLESIHIPLDVVRHLDLKSGRDHGRIYRVAPPGFRFPGQPALSSATTAQLVATLEHPNGWHRDTSLRLLRERGDRSAVPALRQLAQRSDIPQARVLSLWALDGFRQLDDDSISACLSDPHPGVRENAIRLAEPRLGESTRLLDEVIALADDDIARIRFQVAFSLGEVDSPAAVAALAKIARHDGEDRWIRAAVLSSVAKNSDKVLLEVIGAQGGGSCKGVVGGLLQVIGGRNQPTEVAAALDAIATVVPDGRASADWMLAELGLGLRRAGGRFATGASGGGGRLLAEARQRAEVAARAAEGRLEERAAAIELLGCFSTADTRPIFLDLIAADQPERIQVAAIRALADDVDPAVGERLAGSLRSFTPESRRVAIASLLSRDEGTRTLLSAAVRGEVSLTDVEQSQRDLLMRHKDGAIRQAAAQVFGSADGLSRQAVIEEYQASLSLRGSAAAGKLVFEKTCASCHHVAGAGSSIGPNLVSSPARDPAALLTHILDPNRHVLPNYLQYIVVDTSGRTYTGLLTGQTPTSITLKKERDELVTVLRGDIEELACSDKSLMPEGLEKQIPQQAMADLLAYLNEATAAAVGDPNAVRDIGTAPGLIESDDE
jgi:putative membrane-bound dehydrogenase-like protein